ncbi:hypothetical protein [Pararcticibacter amylolyticus]|uniref:hypothetical protein n=1 Tax=Pararcticibacter amylolyticus TaxID=2173175 RepID=UPI001304AA96|nr:hypothetical protein [Pararcticibacter amylolyticus]
MKKSLPYTFLLGVILLATGIFFKVMHVGGVMGNYTLGVGMTLVFLALVALVFKLLSRI